MLNISREVASLVKSGGRKRPSNATSTPSKPTFNSASPNSFAKDMPAVETRRHVLKKELSELADNRRRDAEQGVNANQRGDTRGDERDK